MPEETPAAGSQLYFGADAIDSIGIVQSCTENGSVEVAEAKNENGRTIEEMAYAKNKEYSIEALIKVAVTPPEEGSVITIAGGQYLVRSCNKTRSNSEYHKVSITASRKDAATLVAYSAEV